MELLEAPALEGVADDRDVGGVRARELAEAREREEHVLVRVQRGVFGRCAREGTRGREEAGGAREAQVGLAFGCCGVRGGVAAGRLRGKEKARQWAGDAK